jgi:hypothetical protein
MPVWSEREMQTLITHQRNCTKDAYEYALSMSMYSFPSGSQTLYMNVSVYVFLSSCELIGKDALCTFARLEYDRKGMVAVNTILNSVIRSCSYCIVFVSSDFVDQDSISCG